MSAWDAEEHWATHGRPELLAQGAVTSLSRDTITSPEGETLVREFLRHPGSVIIIAQDDDDRIAVVHQYRHPVGMRLIEAPAGLLDVAGEPAWDGAKRELAEEAGLAADDWRVLADYVSSPGISTEVGRIYLARGLHQVGRPAGFAVHGEEVDMGLAWVSLDEVIAGIRAGLVDNVALAYGCTALKLALLDGTVDRLRPADAPWPAHEVKQRLDAARG